MLPLVYILASVLILLYLWKQRNSYTLYWKLSGPMGYPFIGSLLSFKNQSEVLQELGKLEQKYKSPYAAWLGPQLVVITTDPDTMEVILTSPKCVNKNFVYNFLSDLIGDGLFTSNVPVWNTRIKVVKPTFKRRMILGFYSIFNEQASELCNIIGENLHNKDFSLFHYVQLAALKATCQTTLGDSHLDIEKIDFEKILNAFSHVMAAMVERMFKPIFYESRIYKLTKHYKKAVVYRDFIVDMLERKIVSKKTEMDARTKEAKEENEENDDDMKFNLPPSLLEYILANNNYNLTLDELRSEVVVLIAAGFETTAVGLYISILCLAMHPEEQDKLYDELCSVFPDKEFDVTEDQLKQLTYTEMCISEAMRVISPVPVVGRVTMDDIKLKNGNVLHKDTELLLDIFNLHRSEKHWGPKAKVFDPENFHPDKLKHIHPYAYIPFTKGSRMCVGFKYSVTLMKIFLAKVYRNYKISSEQKFGDLEFIENISIKIKNHPTFKFEKRE